MDAWLGCSGGAARRRVGAGIPPPGGEGSNGRLRPFYPLGEAGLPALRASGVPDDLADLDAVDGDRVASRRVRPDLFRGCPRGLLGFEDDYPSAGAVVEADPVPGDEAWRLLEARDARLVQELPTPVDVVDRGLGDYCVHGCLLLWHTTSRRLYRHGRVLRCEFERDGRRFATPAVNTSDRPSGGPTVARKGGAAGSSTCKPTPTAPRL